MLLLVDINKLSTLLIKRAILILYLELTILYTNTTIFKVFNKKIDFKILNLASSIDIIKCYMPMLF